MSPGCRNCRNCRNCRTTVGQLSDYCRTTVGLSDCRTIRQLSDSCRTTVGTVGQFLDGTTLIGCRTLSDTVGHCRNCRTVGLSDCRTLSDTVGLSECWTSTRRGPSPSTSPLSQSVVVAKTADISPFANLPIWAASLPLEEKDASHHS